MSDSLLEQCRKLHSEVGHLKTITAASLTRDSKGFRDQLKTDEKTRARLQKVVENIKALQRIHTEGSDEHETRIGELSEISGPKAFSVFYEKVADLKRSQQTMQANAMYSFSARPEEVDVIVNKKWSGPEWTGRFVDLVALHTEFQNLSRNTDLSYKKYLRTFHHFHRIPNKDKQFQSYLQRLLEYLVQFWDRQNPLYSSDRVRTALNAEFSKKWDDKKVEGWQISYNAEKLQAMEADVLGDSALLGPQMLEPLEDVALYDIISQKWFRNIGSLEGHRKGKKYKKKQEIIKNNPDFYRAFAFREAQIDLFAGLLEETIVRTIEFVEKRQTKSYDEVRREIEEAENDNLSSDESDGEEEGGVIYNPLNIPVDFDGKPIPYWLYKFRGLNRYFKCQICGGREYRGPMAFERHFSEWRHAHAMRTLGIPNTKDFMWITNITDAINLWGKIKDRKKDAVWNPADEEVEDQQGNVFNRPTYENLHFQHGLIN